MARLTNDLRGILRSELAGVEVRIVGRQVVGGRLVSLLVLLPGSKFMTKVPPWMVESDDTSVTCHAPSRVTVTNHVTKRPLKRVPRMPL